jgi:4'-phosphopantetheinyl transferase
LRTVHCHRLELAQATAADTALLDAGERDRAARFRFEHLRIRHVAAHAGMRRLLGQWLDLDPAKVPITTTGNGKPVLAAEAATLAGPQARSVSPHFNLTHCEAVGYLGIAPFEIGVDVEATRPLADLDSLAESCCSPGERARLAQLPTPARVAAFLRMWTRKEAALKAWGTGIGAVPLSDVEAEPDTLHADSLPGGAGLPPLRLQTLTIDGDLVLSVAAVSDAPFEVRLIPR